MRLKDKVAVITGASSGIGRATAVLFAREGAKVACVDIDEKGGKETVAMIKKDKSEAVFIRADVSVSEDVRQMAQKCQDKFGKVDILFNNAGRLIWQDFEETTEDTWAQMIGTNLTSIFLCSKYLLPLMKKAGRGSIINNGSIDGQLGNPSIIAYTAAKGGIIPLSHVMAHNLAKYNIRVNVLSTGGIASSMIDQVQKANPEKTKKIVALAPMGRMGTPEEVAYAALFFATDEPTYVTGATLVVDGGRTGITQGMF